MMHYIYYWKASRKELIGVDGGCILCRTDKLQTLVRVQSHCKLLVISVTLEEKSQSQHHRSNVDVIRLQLQQVILTRLLVVTTVFLSPTLIVMHHQCHQW